MTKITLTVDSQYVDWGINQGIRELIQNGIDAHTKGFGLHVEYNKDSKKLRIFTSGISIPKSSLLIGYSTKKGDDTQIGEFGEGYKLGCMALVKNGLTVEIETKNERWTPILERSEAFERDVLAFLIHPTNKQGESVEFIVGGLSEEAWDEAKKQFLMFDDKRKYQAFETRNGQILSGPDYKGRIYINGILIQQITDEEYEFGYNFTPGKVKVDRDRKMADRYQLKSVAAQCMTDYASREPSFFETFERCLKQGSADVKGIYNVDSDLEDKLHASFMEKFGEDYLPVENEGDAKEAAHFGKRGKVFSAPYVNAMSRRCGTLYDLKASFGKKVQEIFNPLTLTKKEQRNLLKAQDAVGMAVQNMPPIEIAKFIKSSGVLGLYHRDSDKVTLNRAILKDYGQTLATLIHEVGHRAGGDGSKEHHDEMTRIWIAVATGPRPKRRKREVSKNYTLTDASTVSPITAY